MNRGIFLRGAAAAALLLGLNLATSATAAEKRQEKKDDGDWVSLFDGKTLGGWEAVELGGTSGESHWEVKDGVIVGTGKASMLYSPTGGYKNFRFRAEVKINDHGNSGMYVHCPEKKATFTDGYEIQINSTHADPIKTGSVYTMVHVFEQLVPPDTWFTQEVEVVVKDYRGKVLPYITISVNGKTLYQYIDHSNAFPGPGYFAFQQHDPGSRVEIRKVEVKELP